MLELFIEKRFDTSKNNNISELVISHTFIWMIQVQKHVYNLFQYKTIGSEHFDITIFDGGSGECILIVNK